MKSNDQLLLEQAYDKVAQYKVDEKVSMKGALAGAALGLGTMLGTSHAADNVASTVDKQTEVADKKSAATQITPQQAYQNVLDLVNANQKIIPKNLTKIILTDKALTNRLAHTLTLREIPLPKELKAVVGDYDKNLKSSIVGP